MSHMLKVAEVYSGINSRNSVQAPTKRKTRKNKRRNDPRPQTQVNALF